MYIYDIITETFEFYYRHLNTANGITLRVTREVQHHSRFTALITHNRQITLRANCITINEILNIDEVRV